MNSSLETKKIAIIGAGLVGSLLAARLGARGFSVDVYEKRCDVRLDTKARGRTIAMSLSERGWRALRAVELEEKVRAKTNPKYARMVHHLDETSDTQLYGDGTEAIYTINRNYLNQTLIDAAEMSGDVHFYFDHTLEDMNPDSGEITLVNTNGGDSTSTKKYDRIIGADGIFSKVCDILTSRGFVAFDRTTLAYGYKELRIPRTEQGDYALPNHHIHVWPRLNSVLIAFPTIEKEFVCTLFLPLTGVDSIETLDTPKALSDFFNRNFSDVIPVMPGLYEDFFTNPASKITYLKGSPWHYKDKVLLLGDAAHSITPFYGMGMNVGFEDVTVLMELLEKYENDFGAAFQEFSEIRKPNTDAIAELSLINLNSISESPDPSYNIQWNLERRIWKLMPEVWTPAYVMIAFTNQPLGDVIQKIEKQDAILKKLIASENIADIDDETLVLKVTELLGIKETIGQMTPGISISQ